MLVVAWMCLAPGPIPRRQHGQNPVIEHSADTSRPKTRNPTRHETERLVGLPKKQKPMKKALILSIVAAFACLSAAQAGETCKDKAACADKAKAACCESNKSACSAGSAKKFVTAKPAEKGATLLVRK
jgi:hypothetical protein